MEFRVFLMCSSAFYATFTIRFIHTLAKDLQSVATFARRVGYVLFGNWYVVKQLCHIKCI